MLALDDRVTPALQPNKELVETAQRQIATLPLARQAYSSILGLAAGMTPLNIYEQLSDTQVDQVLRTVDGTALSDLTVPGLFTFSGYWGVFKEELASRPEPSRRGALGVGRAWQSRLSDPACRSEPRHSCALSGGFRGRVARHSEQDRTGADGRSVRAIYLAHHRRRPLCFAGSETRRDGGSRNTFEPVPRYCREHGNLARGAGLRRHERRVVECGL